MKIYYNPRCSKCRETLKLIEQQGKKAEIVDYLNHPPTVETLKQIVRMLGISPLELVRKKETLYLNHFRHQHLNDDEWLKVMSEHPQLIERPIVLEGKKAIIGRPPEKVLDLL